LVERAQNIVEDAMSLRLANVLVSSAPLASLDAFARAERTPERRKPPC
jgi:hypothetical protein